jgi:hypothetical protein
MASRHCVINQAEATIVRQMFTWLIETLNPSGARRLTAEQVPTRHGQHLVASDGA